MKCFYHNESDALGICKHCQKGVCKECLSLVDNSISCKESCEEDVAALNYMIEKGKKVYKNLGKQWSPAIIVNGVGGLFFIGFGIYNYAKSSSWLLIGLGSIMLVGGISSVIQARRMGEKN